MRGTHASYLRLQKRTGWKDTDCRMQMHSMNSVIDVTSLGCGIFKVSSSTQEGIARSARVKRRKIAGLGT